MNKRKRKHLMEKMIGILLLGFFLALLLFLLIFFMGNGALNRYFESSMYRRNVSKETIAMFQEYVSRHHLAASDTERIREWAKENHIGYFTISRKRMLLYDNYYALPVALDRTKSEQLHYTWQYFQEVSFTDGNADVFIYVNRERKYYILVDVAAALCGVLVWIGVFAFGVSGYVRYIRQLSGEVAKLEDGLWSVDFTIKGEDELTDLARGLEHMKTVLLEKEEKERNMKKAQNKLVLGMAHDLRTPLTALMAYLEIIKREPEHDKVKLYVKKTVGKAIQIMEKQPGTRVEVATSRTSLALIELKMDKLEAAEKHLELAISAFKEDGGKTDTHYSAALAGLGEVCYRQGSLERSLENYEHALFEVEKHFGRKEGYGLLCGNCAAICRELGQSAKAEEYEVQRKKYCPEA